MSAAVSVSPVGSSCRCDGSMRWRFGVGGVGGVRGHMGVGHWGQEAGLNRHHGFGWNRDLRRETHDVTRPSDCVSCELLLFLLSCFTL